MIYLDNAATTKVCPEAAEAAVAAMTACYGNPSSGHPLGKSAAELVKSARADLAAALGCAPGEVYFTSCGTEGDNWAVRGAVELGRRKGKHIITTAIEHSAVLSPIRALERQGYTVTYLKPDRTGHVSVGALAAALRPDTVLVSMMLVNNELGTVQDVAGAARAIRAAGSPALLHTDAVQGFLKVPFTVEELGIDLLAISGHKLYAPKGVGALYIKRGVKLPPVFLGGGQEDGLRPGTEATAQIAALAAAVRTWRPEYCARMEAVKAYALEQLTALPGVEVVSPGDVPHICAVSLPGYPSEMLVRALGDAGVCVSSGSACHKGKPSHVFSALGLPKQTLMGILRVSLSPESAREDVDALCRALAGIREARVSAQ
jgi:cysteine desulfurase